MLIPLGFPVINVHGKFTLEASVPKNNLSFTNKLPEVIS
jgi:hypothetical protein